MLNHAGSESALCLLAAGLPLGYHPPSMAGGRWICGAALAAAALAAAGPARAAAEEKGVRVSVRIVERESGTEARWGATGQLLVDHGAEERGISPSAQLLYVPAGGRGEIRIARSIPFVGWFLRRAQDAGMAEPDAEWRDVAAALEVEALPPGEDGEARVALTPELSFTQGRGRRRAAFASARLELALPAGTEVRLAPAPGQEEFYGRLLAAYDPQRRVRPVDLVLRALPPGDGGP